LERTQTASSTGIVELAAGGVLRTSRQMKTVTGGGRVVFKRRHAAVRRREQYDPWIATNIAVCRSAVAEGRSIPGGLAMKLGSSGLSGAGCWTQTGGGSVVFSQSSTNWAGGLSLADGAAVVEAVAALGTGAVTPARTPAYRRVRSVAERRRGVDERRNNRRGCRGDGGAVASVNSGRLVKGDAGALLCDDMTEGVDVDIRGGTR
jgi:hypothetical protein